MIKYFILNAIGAFIFFVGGILIILGYGLPPGNIAKWIDFETMIGAEEIIGRIVIATFGFILVLIGRKFIVRAKINRLIISTKHSQIRKDCEIFHDGKIIRDFILYLRGFRSDEGNARTYMPEAVLLSAFQVNSVEEQLVKSLNQYGEVVAVRSPSDNSPTPGAIKLYIEDKDWKKTVSRLITKARLVVIIPDLSGGVQWELQECLLAGNRQKSAIVIPPNEEIFTQIVNESMNVSSAELNEYFKYGEKNKLPIIVYFDNTGNLQATNAKFESKYNSIRNPLLPHFIFGFKNVLLNNGFDWSPPRIGGVQKLFIFFILMIVFALLSKILLA